MSNGLINRDLLKVKYFSEPVKQQLLEERLAEAMIKLNIDREDASWLVFTGEASGSTYNFEDEHINIVFKDGSVKDISEVDEAE